MEIGRGVGEASVGQTLSGGYYGAQFILSACADAVRQDAAGLDGELHHVVHTGPSAEPEPEPEVERAEVVENVQTVVELPAELPQVKTPTEKALEEQLRQTQQELHVVKHDFHEATFD